MDRRFPKNRGADGPSRTLLGACHARYVRDGFLPMAEHDTGWLHPQLDPLSLLPFRRWWNVGRADPETVKLTGVYHNLIRYWAEV
jgi:hypothetical protein